MFIHSVYIWLRDDLTPKEKATFIAGVQSLRTIDGVHHGYIGVPAATDRPVIERGYSYALVLAFEDQRAHDAYQVDPVHDRFRDQCSPLWRKIQIFDIAADDGGG